MLKQPSRTIAIVKALETTEKSRINDNIPRTATVHTDSRITLQSLKNTKITITSYKKSGRKR
jgi:hypothetical protein